ncbi:hypothetical protein HA397_30345, partial [Escherichia coli]|nr:hypothetical protein [Escherichia coli]
MKTYSFWANPTDMDSVPPYILMGLVSMQRALGDDFVLLTPQNVGDYVPQEHLQKAWAFTRQVPHLSPEIMRIIATSDFLRMYVVAERGGVWIDADTIVLRDYRAQIDAMADDTLLWHSEQFFCARQGNPILSRIAGNMLRGGDL